MSDAKTVSIVDEATTLIVSKHGWLRSRTGHNIDPAQLAFRSGDSLLACLPCRTVDHLILLDTKGRAYSIPASDIPGGKGDGVPATSLADFVGGGKAIARSREVEMRFYKYANVTSERPGEPLFYAYQVVETPSGGDALAISEPYYLDSGVVLSTDTQLSPMLETTAVQTENNGQYVISPGSGGGGWAVEFAALRFFPDGSCRLLNSSTLDEDNATATALAYTVPPLSTSFMTLVESQYLDSPTIPPPNYYCIQIDAYTGKARIYRP